MFGVRLSSLFSSRWMALLWAVLICLTAVGFVGAQGGDDDSDAAQARQAAEAANAVIASMN